MLLFIIFCNPYAKDIYKEEDQNFGQEQCLNHLLTHPATKRFYPNLLEDQNNNLYLTFLKEMENYCACYQSNVDKNKKENNLSEIDWRFQVKKVRFDIADSCSMEHFSAHALYHNYYVMIQTYMRNIVTNKLSERMTRGIRSLASTSSIRSRHYCLENKILNHCSKIKSLSSTYKCINSTVSELNKIERFEKQCPGLTNKDNPRTPEQLRI
jgi:hypothetical protein